MAKAPDGAFPLVQEDLVMTHLQPSPLLRRALLLDAAASGATGLLMSLAAGWLIE